MKKTIEQKKSDYLSKFKKRLWNDRIRGYLNEHQKDIYWGKAYISYDDKDNTLYMESIYPKENGKLLDAYTLPVERVFKDFYKKEGYVSFHVFNPSPYDRKENWECFHRSYSQVYDNLLGETPCEYLSNNPDWEYHESCLGDNKFFYVGKSYERTIDIPLNEVIKEEDDLLAYEDLKRNHPDWV